MSIKIYIQEQILAPRLKQKEVLVVYDPDRRFHDLCMEMASDEIKVVDASASSIVSREAAMRGLLALGRINPPLSGLLIYAPTKAPTTPEAQQRDPFALYGVIGGVFPDGAGDEYPQICLKAKPDQATAIRRIFSQDASPAFEVIDAVGGGQGWPVLETALQAESASDILFALLAPRDHQKKTLAAQAHWVAEAKELLRLCLGLKLITRGKTWATIADELWRFVLYSEFVFDLPEALPEALANVPRAPSEARPLIEDLCERLRNDRRAQTTYMQRAQQIETDLDLPEHCRHIHDLGLRDTFPFEEQSFLARSVEAFEQDDTDRARYIVEKHTATVWSGIGESQARWGLMRSALALCEACADYEGQLADHAHDMDALIDFYTGRLREIDRLHREFEQAAADMIDAPTIMDGPMQKARNAFGAFSSRVQDLFIRHLEQTGWPPLGRLANTDLFDQMVAPHLQQSGRRIAYFMIDSLRYELGVALWQQLAEDDAAELKAAMAPLPSVTSVGMAALLPQAAKRLEILLKDNKIVPKMGSSELAQVKQRMDILRKRYGPRFGEMTLTDFIRRRKKLPADLHLLVLRGAEIDSHLEIAPETALRLIHDTLKRIRAAIHKLKDLGFDEAVIATDHGFGLNIQAQAGDVCAKPSGDWIFVHERLALGQGAADSANFVLPAEQVGLRGAFQQVSGPRGLVCFRAGQAYFHGGASLQECVAPVIAIHLSPNSPEAQKPKIRLDYKNGAQRITTRLPVVDLFSDEKQMDLFQAENETELLIEAHSPQGDVVGEAKAGGVVNPATGAVALKEGGHVRVTLKMDETYEGSFTVKAMDPATFTVYGQMTLKTDYVV